MSSTYAARAYAATAVNNSVEAASPHRLIQMLYEAAIRNLRVAKSHLAKNEIPQKAQCMSKAMDIITQGLRANLNDDAGGEIAANLRMVYDYCERQLLLANARNDVKLIDEVISLLEPLLTAWKQIGNQGQPVSKSAAVPR